MLRIAITVLLGVVLAGPGAQEAFQRGLLALKENHLSQALEEFSKAETANPHDARIHNFRGITLARLGRKAAAAEEYRQAIRLDPAAPDAYRNLGYLEWTERHFDGARQALRKALKLNPQDRYARYYLGRVELDQGHFQAGLEDLESAQIPLPNEPDFLLEVAAGYLAIHREPRARPIIARLRSLHLNARQTIRLGSLLLATHQNAEALSLFRRLNARHPDPGWARFDWALANLKAGEWRAAASLVEPLTTATHQSAESWTLLGIACARLREDRRAITAFRYAAALEPSQEDRWLDLTHEQMHAGDLAGAASAAQEGLKHNPRSYALHLRLGAAYLQAGRYKLAEEVFRKLISMGDPTPTSAIGLAQVLLRTGRGEEAVRELAATRQRLGPSFLLVYFQGIACSRAGEPRKAAAMFREAVKLNPQSGDAFRWLGAMELHLRETQEAIRHLHTALRLDPDSRQAQRLLAQAYATLHEPQRAAQYLRQQAPPPLPKSGEGGTQDFSSLAWKMPGPASH